MKFTAEIWNPEAPEPEIPKNKKVSINRNLAFPYLDIEIYWYQEESLAFKVHRKPNQILNYVSKDSTHTKHCHAAILYGVIRRLSILTTVTDENKNLTIDTLYPYYVEALTRAGLVSKDFKFPTIQNSKEKKSEENQHQTKFDVIPFLKLPTQTEKDTNRQTTKELVLC